MNNEYHYYRMPTLGWGGGAGKASEIGGDLGGTLPVEIA